MLPAAHRLRRRVDFADTVRRGRRAARPTLVVHLLDAGPTGPHAGGPGSPAMTADTSPSRPAAPARAGFVVSKAVGGSVVRHAVTRRLRHLVAARLDRLAPGSLLVVRALPPAATASSHDLGADLDAALERASRRPAAAGAPR